MDPLLYRADKAIVSTRETVDRSREARARMARNRAIRQTVARRRRKELVRLVGRYSTLVALARIACGDILPTRRH